MYRIIYKILRIQIYLWVILNLLLQGDFIQSVYLTSLTGNREIYIPKCVVKKQIAYFQFVELCNQPLGASDYVAIARV